jgi:hypothetical protein
MALINLTGINTIKYDIRASRTGSNIKIGIHDTGGTTTEHTANISAANTFETQTWDISGVADANKDAIDKIIITILNADAANIFYIDNMFAGDNVTVDVGLQSGSKSLFSVSENTDQILSQNLVSGNKTLFSPSFILDQILAQNLQAGSNTIFQASHVTDQILSQNLLASITSLLSVLVSIDQNVSVNVIPAAGGLYEVTVEIIGIGVTIDLGLLLAVGSALETSLQADQILSQGIIEKLGSIFTPSQNTDQILNQNILSALGAVLTSSQIADVSLYLNALSALAVIYQILVQIKGAPEKFGYLNLKLELPPALAEGDFAYERSSLKMPDLGPEGSFTYQKLHLNKVTEQS